MFDGDIKMFLKVVVGTGLDLSFSFRFFFICLILFKISFKVKRFSILELVCLFFLIGECLSAVLSFWA